MTAGHCSSGAQIERGTVCLLSGLEVSGLKEYEGQEMAR